MMTETLMATGTNKIVPLSAEIHGDWTLDLNGEYGYARKFGLLPIVVGEIPIVARSFPVLFGRDEEGIKPLALMTIDKDDLHRGSTSERLDEAYVPTVLREYPFLLGTIRDDDRALLCIDEAYAGLNREGRGVPLFDRSGQPAEAVIRAMEFGHQLAGAKIETDRFCARLQALEILVPVDVDVDSSTGEGLGFHDFQTVSIKNLKSIGRDKAHELLLSDMMEILFAQLRSIEHLDEDHLQVFKNEGIEYRGLLAIVNLHQAL